MGIVDMIFVIIFGLSLYKGFKNGVIVEVCGILGFIISIFLAVRYKADLAVKFDMDPHLANIVAFVLIVLLGSAAIYLAAKLVTGLLNITGLGVLNSLLGAFAALVKMIIVVSLATSVFLAINSNYNWVSRAELSKSVILPKLNKVSKNLFGHVDFLKQYYNDIKNTIFENEGSSNQGDRELV